MKLHHIFIFTILPRRNAAKRIENGEQFLNKFPKSEVKTKLKEEWREYSYAYLIGYDDTSTRNDDGSFTSKNQLEFKRFKTEILQVKQQKSSKNCS